MTQPQEGSQRFSEPQGLYFTCVLLQLWPGVRDKGTKALYLFIFKRKEVGGDQGKPTLTPPLQSLSELLGAKTAL